MNEIKTKRTLFYDFTSNGLLILFLVICFFSFVFNLSGLWAWNIGKHALWRNSILFFYSSQVCIFLLVIWVIFGIVTAIKKREYRYWKSYIPVMVFIIYCLAIFLISSVIVFGYAIPVKIDNPENRIWSNAMVGRGLGGWSTENACVLSEQAVAFVGIWSFVTPDGRMPVLLWTDGLFPNSDLPGNPTLCSQLQPEWYICYLTKPYQLVINQSGLCDSRVEK